VKHLAEMIFRRALAAVDVRTAFENKVERDGSYLQIRGERFDLHAYREIFAIAIGKAASAMAEGLQRVLAPDFSLRGVLVVPNIPPHALPEWKIIRAGHPVPTAESFEAARAILELLQEAGKDTLVFFLLSGGGSSLVELPLDPGVTLADFQELHRVLVTCGAPIEEINAVRKHLSAVKGGRLALAAPNATKITLAITDVPEGHESALASGPTLPDPTTLADVAQIARRYALAEKLPSSVRRLFEPGSLRETPKAGDPAFQRARFMLLLGMHDLFHNTHHAAEAEGFLCVCDNSTDNWPIDRATDELLGQLDAMRKSASGRRVAVIADGEVSSPVTGDGIGGRNSAFVLACVPKIAGKNIVVLSAGTDGVDGNSPAAGAIADGQTLVRAQAMGLDPAAYLRRSDAYSFFNALGDAIHTGPTGNNLRDLRLLLHF